MRIEKDLTKLYYSIGEVCQLFDVAPSLIRHWEKAFVELRTKRSSRGNRQYTVKDIRKLEEIYTLVKERGFTLEGARAELRKAKADPKTEVLGRLKKLRANLLNLKNKL